MTVQTRKALAAALPSDPRKVAQLALEIGVSSTTVWRWRKLRAYPSPALRPLVASALGMDYDALFGAGAEEAA